MFTDIEGSTRLWEQAPQQMSVALQLHDRILRRAIEDNAGFVFKTVGDAFCAAFPAAESAVAAAVRAEMEVEAQSWATPRPIRVRIGLHSGNAEERENDYFGPAVNRAARLEAIGHGGQVLLSGACAELARHALPPGVGLLDLGDHRLKDLGLPERVYQVTHASLPAGFRPLASLDVERHNLPVLLTALVGREREIQEIEKLLGAQEVRLVTITGPGGIGKTRLALQVGANLVGRFRHGVFLVDLSPVSAPEGFLPCVAAALGIKEGGGSLELTIQEHLSGKEILLLLDNLEQLVSAVPSLAALLGRCPKLRVLATSRELLHMRGEHVYDVPPLGLPPPTRRMPADPWGLRRYDAVSLFVECARRHDASFDLTTENAASIAGLCRRLDGLPLAIELAAARLRLFSPQSLLQRLEDRLKVLGGGHRDLPQRQRTLRAAFDWSHELLTERERLLFAGLSVFSGGFSAEAAEGILGDGMMGEADLYDVLGSLVDKSLVRRQSVGGSDPRFSLLETIREYALERLEKGEGAARLRDAHAAFFLDLAREAERGLHGASRQSWMSGLDLELENIRAALHHLRGSGDVERQLDLAACMARYFRARGAYKEGRQWLAEATPESCRASVRVRARALRGAGALAQYQGEYRTAADTLRQAVRLFEGIGEIEGAAFAYRDLGWSLCRLRSLEEALHAFSMCRALAEQRGNTYLAALGLLGIGTIHRERGETADAREYLTRSLEVFRAQGDRESEASALGNIGMACLQEGDLVAARRSYLEVMGIETEIGDTTGLAIAYNNLGDIHVRLGELEEASGFYDRLAQIAEETASSSLLAVAYTGMAECALGARSYNEALTYAKLASGTAEEQGNTLYQGVSLRVLGEAYLLCDDHSHAAEALRRAITLLDGLAGGEEDLGKTRKSLAAAEAGPVPVAPALEAPRAAEQRE